MKDLDNCFIKFKKICTVSLIISITVLVMLHSVISVNAETWKNFSYDQSNPSYHYFYDQLNDESKRIYDAMEEMYEGGIFAAGEDYDLTAKGKVTGVQLQSFVNGNSKLIDDYGAARDAFQYDYPDVFYVDFSLLSIRVIQDSDGVLHGYLGAGRADTYLLRTFTKDNIPEAVKKYENAIETALKDLPTTKGEYETLAEAQTYYIHDYLVDYMIYHYENEVDEPDCNSRTAYDALVYGEGVCEAYTRGFKALMDRAGIPTICVYGVYRPSDTVNEMHIWNYVQIDDIWYGVDVTHDDPVVKGSNLKKSGKETREFCLVGEFDLVKHHIPSGIMSTANYEFTYPELGRKEVTTYYDKDLVVVLKQEDYKIDVSAENFYSEESDENVKGEESDKDVKGEESEKEVKGEELEEGIKSEESYESIKSEKSYEGLKGEESEEDVKGEEAEEDVKGEEAEEDVKGEESEEVIKSEEAEEDVKGEESEEGLKSEESEEDLKNEDSAEYSYSAVSDEVLKSGTFYVSYRGKNYTQNAAEGYYILGRYGQYFPGTDEWKYSDWGYLTPEYYGIDMEPSVPDPDMVPEGASGDEYGEGYYVRLPMPQVMKAQFAVTTIPPTFKYDGVNISGSLYYGGDLAFLTVKSEEIYNEWGDYVAPPYPKTVSPGMDVIMKIGSTNHIKVVYDDILKEDGSGEKVGVEVSQISAFTGGVVTGQEHSKIENVQWDGMSTVDFDFTPSQYYADHDSYYILQVTGLVGEKSLKRPIALDYGCAFQSSYCSLGVGGFNWRIFGFPQLLDTSDIDTSGWEAYDIDTGDTYNNVDILESISHRLMLVTQEPTPAKAEEMGEMLKSEVSNVVDQKIYNIQLSLCKSMIVKTGESVRVCVGFPEGYNYSSLDEGITFKAYHYIVDPKTDQPTGEIEEINCIITEYGLIIECKSFSPFAIAAVKGEQDDSTKTVVFQSGGNGAFYSGQAKLEGKDGFINLTHTGDNTVKDITVKAEDGYVINAVVIDNKRIQLGENIEEYAFTLDYNNYKNQTVIVSAEFTSAKVYEQDIANGFNYDIVPDYTDDSVDQDGQKGIQIIGLEESYEYTGSKIIPNIGVVDYDADGGKLLVPGVDYTVQYKNNTKVGIKTAEVKVTGKGNYIGKAISEKFSIENANNAQTDLKDLKGAKITGLETGLTYDGEAKYPGFTLTLKKGTPKQYKYNKEKGVYETEDGEAVPADVALSNNINKGTATILLIGDNGTKIKKTFRIAAINLTANADKVKVEVTSGTYAVKGAAPASITVTYDGKKLKNGTDYTVKYSSNKKVTTSAKIVITGKGNYAKKYVAATYAIEKLKLSNVKVSAVTAYAGLKAGKVKATVVDGQGNALKASQYTLYVYKNKNDDSPCDASEVLKADSKIYVEAQAKDTVNLEGVTPRDEFDIGTNIAKAKVTDSNGKTVKKSYTGTPITFTAENADELKVTLNGADLKMGTDYKIVSYSNNTNKGTATAVIKGIGSYSGTKTFKFKISAKQMQIDGKANWDDILNLIKGFISFNPK